MKTPEQIADEVYTPVHEEWAWALGRNRLVPLMAAAIEADRAQRRIPFDTLDHMLNAWENYDGDVSGFMDAWLDHFNKGTEVPDWAKA